jgi:hypothetical protein
MIRNKKGFLARDWVIAFVLFSAVIALFTLSVVGVANNYGRSDMVDSGFQSRYNKMVSLTNDKNTMLNSVRSGQGLTLAGTFDIAFGATFTVIQLVFSSIISFEMIGANLVSDLAPFIDPSVLVILVNVLITCITVTIVFVWLSSISRGRF